MRKKFNRYEKKVINSARLKEALSGAGLYLYENRFDAELTLPRPTNSGLRIIEGKAQFQGDDYYMQMVRSGELRLIEVIQTPEQQKEAEMSEDNKLILDQPDTITEQGKVEHVPAQPAVQPMNEGGDQKEPDVLINESPDGFVICDD